MTDRRRPLGDTDEAHDEIGPHDLPPGHPGRRAAEREAAERGAVRGHRAGGAGGEPLGDAERDGAEVRGGRPDDG